VERRWHSFKELEFTEFPAVDLSLVLDEPNNELYLFWKDNYEDEPTLPPGERPERRALFYSKKPIGAPVSPPVVAESGPLQLHANYPNPFNPATVIPFTLEEAGEVELIVYDVLGRQVVRQELGNRSSGFNQHELNLAGLTSGPYIYEIILDGRFRQQETMMFVK
jgi:hypothetical protein